MLLKPLYWVMESTQMPANLYNHMQRVEYFRNDRMNLLNTYEDRDEAEDAARKLTGERRLASERDGTVIIYNLFGVVSWGNFHRLDMYNLHELQALLSRRESWGEPDAARHRAVLATLSIVAKNHNMALPAHWL